MTTELKFLTQITTASIKPQENFNNFSVIYLCNQKNYQNDTLQLCCHERPTVSETFDKRKTHNLSI